MDGLYLLVQPNGSRWWRIKFYFDGVEKMLSLGVYPEITLKRARERRDEIRRQVADGIDPSSMRKAEKRARANTFEAVAREWIDKHTPTWSDEYARNIARRLEPNIFRWLGDRPVKDIKAPELLRILRRIEGRGANETAHRALQSCGRVFRYAVATGRAERDVSRDLLGALAPVIERHHASITEPRAVAAIALD